MPEATTARNGAPPDFPELLARAEALVPVLRERAGRAEELRRIPDDTIDDLHRTGQHRQCRGGCRAAAASIISPRSAAPVRLGA